MEQPQAEHQWLDAMVGEWTIEMEYQTEEGETATDSSGRTTVRSLGGMWIVMEGSGGGPGEESMTSRLTLGFDTTRGTYVGTFVASMMSYLWIYTSGSVDEAGKKLTLNAEGPNFDQSGMAQYQDTFEIIDQDHWRLSSQIVGEGGSDEPFMVADYHRSK